MSGGSYNYAFERVQEFIAEMEHRSSSREYDGKVLKYRARFAAHLRLVAKAMQAVEWADSGDSSDDAAKRAIKDVLP